MGSWGGHVKSWMDESGLPVHLARYEDLRHDAEATFGAWCASAVFPMMRRVCARRWPFSDFGELQRQEQEKGFRERSAQTSAFFRSGRAGAWRKELPMELAKRLIETHGETMKRFGYLDEYNEPV